MVAVGAVPVVGGRDGVGAIGDWGIRGWGQGAGFGMVIGGIIGRDDCLDLV